MTLNMMKVMASIAIPIVTVEDFLEIGNSVFMEFVKTETGFDPLPQKNVDFGGGLERIAAVIQNESPDVFKTDVFVPVIAKLESLSNKKYDDELYAMRLIADHLRASVFMMADGVFPGNKGQGYFLRRLLRRSIMQAIKLEISEGELSSLLESYIESYKEAYPELTEHKTTIIENIKDEETKFRKVIGSGKQKLSKVLAKETDLDAKGLATLAFDFFQTHGLPLEISLELFNQELSSVDNETITTLFDNLKNDHADKSRSTSANMFKGGLAEHSEITTQYHTATHLLHQALRDVLGDHVQQMGSNITGERLRFDFKHTSKLSDDEKSKVESIINQKIDEALPMTNTEEEKEAALNSGALAFFGEKYPDQVSVYTIGKDSANDWYSKELCGGPHVSNTSEIGPIELFKQKSIGAGVIRIYARLK